MKNFERICSIKVPTERAKEGSKNVELFLDDLIKEVDSKMKEDGEIRFGSAESELLLSNLKFIRNVNHGTMFWSKAVLEKIMA